MEEYRNVITVFTRINRPHVFFAPQFFKCFRVFPCISQLSILHRGMVTHSYCRSWQPVTSFVLQECGISAVLIRTLGLYYNAETFHFKFMNRIPNSGSKLKVTSKTTPSKNSAHIFRTLVFGEKIDQNCENYASKYGSIFFFAIHF
jgi:hypothetical protein